MPARDKGQPIARQQRPQGFGVVLWPTVAVFDPVKADLSARLIQNAGGGDIGAKGLVVVIGPCNGIGAEADHVLTCCLRLVSYLARAAFTSGRALTSGTPTSHQLPPTWVLG